MMNFYKICGNLSYNEVILLEFMGTLQAAKKWGIPRDTIAKYCREGKSNLLNTIKRVVRGE